MVKTKRISEKAKKMYEKMKQVLMEEFAEISRKKDKDSSKDLTLYAEQTDALETKMQLAKTNDDLKYTWDSLNGGGQCVEAKV